MAKFRVGSNSIARWDASAGGTLVNLTAYLDTIDGVGQEFMSLDVTRFADATERVIPGIQTGQEFTVRGHFDDTSTGPDAIFGSLVGTIASFEWNPIGTAAGRRKINFEVLTTRYVIMGEAKGRVEFEASCRQDGSATWGTN